uniref:CX domain-containing protein n=1 Tax=Meloidogyne floridensis TaxID=298350 RepID=A0A915NLY7_9BILA
MTNSNSTTYNQLNFMSSFPTGHKFRWVLNYDLRNCSGNLCPPNTLCMRPEYSYYPTHCVHINNVDDVDQHLSNGPIYFCNDGIAQYITQGMLIALCFMFFWRSSSKKVSDRKNKKTPSICDSITANLELLTSPRLDLTPPRLNFPTSLCEVTDQPTNNSEFSTNSLSTKFYERTKQRANSSTSLFSSEYSVPFAPYQNV